MRNLVLLTSSFPYEGGEQFLETEIQYWQNTGFDNIYVIPSSCNGEARYFPPEIKIINKRNVSHKLIYAIAAFFNIILYKEILHIVKSHKVKEWVPNFITALKNTAATLREKNRLFSSLKFLSKDSNTIYCYWNDISFYAACLLKEEGALDTVISRAHGFDVYKERRINEYMPLKRQLANYSNKIFLLSDGVVNYYKKNYNAELKKLGVARLGVDIPLNIPSLKDNEKILTVLTLSYCVTVKQIDKIMDAVYKYAKINNSIQIEWTHIGGGPLYDELKQRANKLTNVEKKLSIVFLGNIKNTDVKNHLESNYYDVFINASKSEGIPVSIMEAMSYGIPAVAPDIGGIADLVGGTHGYLMPSSFSVDDIVAGIDTICNKKNDFSYRENASKWVAKNFNSSINYPQFVEEVERIVGINDPK